MNYMLLAVLIAIDAAVAGYFGLWTAFAGLCTLAGLAFVAHEIKVKK